MRELQVPTEACDGQQEDKVEGEVFQYQGRLATLAGRTRGKEESGRYRGRFSTTCREDEVGTKKSGRRR